MSTNFEAEFQEKENSLEAKPRRIVVLLGRYLLAFMGALFVSFGVLFVGIAVLSEVAVDSRIFASIALALLGGCVGFFGVLVGTLIAPKKHRAFSPWILTLAGCCFYVWLWWQLGVFFGQRSSEESPFAPALPYLLVGGISCYLYLRFRAFRRKRESREADIGRCSH